MSYYASDDFAVQARKIAIHGLDNERTYMASLKDVDVVLDAEWIDELLSMFSAGRPNSEIHPRLQTYRVAYAEGLQQAPFGDPPPLSAKVPSPFRFHLPPLIMVPVSKEERVDRSSERDRPPHN